MSNSSSTWEEVEVEAAVVAKVQQLESWESNRVITVSKDQPK